MKVREIGDPRGEKRSRRERGGSEDRGRRRVDHHTLLRFTSSRRERRVYAYISDVAFCAHISLRPVLYFLSFSVLPCAFPRLPSRFSRSLLSSVPSPLSPSFLSHALRISFILSPSCPPSPSFVASVVPRASPLLTLRAVFRGSVLLALRFLSSSVLGVPSVLGPDGPIVPRSRLTGLLMAHRIEREVDPCCYAATAAEIHERSERERGSRAETNGRRATAMIIIRADRITSAARRRRGRVFRCCCSITFFLLPPPSPSLSPIPS